MAQRTSKNLQPQAEFHQAIERAHVEGEEDELESGVWLSKSSLKKLLSSLPASPLYVKTPCTASTDSSDESSSQNATRKCKEYGPGPTNIVSLVNMIIVRSRKDRHHSCSPNVLPPIGVFWDIENCQVPNGVSALAVVSAIREKFFSGYREADFVVVCDVTKESPQVVKELNVAQIDLVHVSSICKNAPDEKLRQAMRRFGERHSSTAAAAVIITGDINFASDLNDLRHRKKIKVILVHKANVANALLLCANEHFDFTMLTNDLPARSFGNGVVNSPQAMELFVSNLPEVPVSKIKNRLRLLSDNCGGRVVSVNRNQAVLRFCNEEAALRARLRMQNEDVYGCKIYVGPPLPARTSPNSSTEQTNRLTNSQLEQIQSSSQFESNFCRPVCSDNFPAMAAPVWPSGLQPPKQWFNNTEAAFTPTSHFVTSQHNSTFRSIRGRQIQSPQEEESTSLSAVSSWFHQGLLPPPHPIIPPQLPSPIMRMVPPPAPLPYKPKRRSPSPLLHNQIANPFPIRLDAEGSDCFQPIQTPLNPNAVSSPVDLQVSNLDHSLDPKDMRRLLLNAFKEQVMVLQLSVYTQSDGQLSARVRVPSRQDAQVAVATLHRQRIGNRRVRISIPSQSSRAGASSPSGQIVRAQIAALLEEVPGNSLPLFKLCELYEKRFLASVSLSELNRMRDVVNITDEPSRGRIASLVPISRRSATPSFSDMAFAALKDGQAPEFPYCPIHALDGNNGAGWAEKTLQPLPTVLMSLPELTASIYRLLHSHHGSLPLHSLPLCYESDIGKLVANDGGVPLEHLVTWISGVVLKSSPNGGCIKMLTWGSDPVVKPAYNISSTNSEDSSSSEKGPDRSTSPAQLAAQISLFAREVVELLRASQRCQLPFVKFIPAYHHHFGRQCRVANYGFTRLIDLLDALPNVVQVIGEGDFRSVILSHPAQIRRFTSDLLRVLKAQPNKQALISEIPELLSKILDKNFDPPEYGLCYVADLVARVPQNTIVLTPPLSEHSYPDANTILSLPKRDQTPEEKERTKHFAKEVVSLLQNAPQCTIPFNKFIPAYHHHYGHQCRLADYGMTKLAELLCAVSDVAEVIESSNGERQIMLALPERRNVLAEQVSAILKIIPGQELLLADMTNMYQHQHGIAIDPVKYGASSLFGLMKDLALYLVVYTSPDGLFIKLIDPTQQLGPRVFQLLTEYPEGQMKIGELTAKYLAKFNQQLRHIDLKTLDRMLCVVNEDVYLTPLYKLASHLHTVVQQQGGSCLLGHMYSLFVVQWGYPLTPEDLGFKNISALIASLPDVFVLNGRGKRQTITLRENTDNLSTSISFGSDHRNQAATSTPHVASTSRAGGSSNQQYFPVTWGRPLIPTPAANEPEPKIGDSRDKCVNSPWFGNPWGLQHSMTTSMLDTSWSASESTSSRKLWSPPKCIKNIIAPDASELPMPSGGLLDDLIRQEEAASTSRIEESGDANLSMFSDSGIGQPSPPQPTRRRHRLAAHFSSPIELL